MTTLRVGSYNVAAGLQPSSEIIRQTIATHQLEIVGLQEVDVQTKRTPYNMLTKLAGESFPHTLFSSNLLFEGGQYGNGVISKWPFVFVTEGYFKERKELGQMERRGYQQVIVEKGGKRISCFNTHLSYENPQLRRSQFKELLAELKKNPTAYQLIMGDFNTDQTTAEFDLMRLDYDCVNGADGLWRETFNQEDREMRTNCIDNIFFSRNIQLVDWNIDLSTVSDHYLLYAAFQFG